MNIFAAMAIIDADVMTVLPDVINKSIGLYTDIKYMSLGDVLHLKLKPRTLYTVSKGGHGERVGFRQKKTNGDVFITPVEHLITTYVDMYSLLAGKEDLGNLVTLVVLSLEADMTKEATSALTTGMAYGTYPSSLSIQGAFSTNTLVTLAETVKAYNYGVRPIIAGTATALANVIGDSSLGFRGNYDANGGSINLLKKFYDFDLYQLPQVATGVGYGLALASDTLYVISPAVDKLVKGAVSNALTNSNQFYDNADLTQNYTMRKMYDFQFASSAIGGMYKITG